MTARPAVLLLHPRLSLSRLFESAERSGIGLLVVPRPGEVIDPGTLPDSVVGLLRLDVIGDPEGAMETLHDQHAEAPFDGVLNLDSRTGAFAAMLTAELGLPAQLDPAGLLGEQGGVEAVGGVEPLHQVRDVAAEGA